MPPILIRPETAEDAAAIRAVVAAAFPSPVEADLVERLRADGDAVLSLVAVEGAEDAPPLGELSGGRSPPRLRGTGILQPALTNPRKTRVLVPLSQGLRPDSSPRGGASVEGDRVVGHVMFSKITAPFRALGLAPVAVEPSRQNTGVGKRLIAAGLALAEAAGWQGVFVLGDPAYYGRFGFTADAAAGFESPYAGPYLMALPLGARRLAATDGEIAYAPAFSELD